MSSLYKFRCRCLGSGVEVDSTDRCTARTTRKTAICKSCDAICKKSDSGPRKLVRKTENVRLYAGLHSR